MRLLACVVLLGAVSFACTSRADRANVSATEDVGAGLSLPTTSTATATPSVTSTPVSVPPSSATSDDGAAAAPGGGKLFSKLLGGAIGSAADGDVQPGPGDETLKRYLLRSDDLPVDFRDNIRTGVVSVPDEISATGTLDVAFSWADSSEGSEVLVMVTITRFNALAETASLLDPARRMTDADFRTAISSDLDDGEFIQGFRRLNVSQLGEGALGVELSTLSYSDYDYEADRWDENGASLVTTYTLYAMPVRNYVETVYAVGFSEPGAPTPRSPDIGELARILRARLMSAP